MRSYRSRNVSLSVPTESLTMSLPPSPEQSSHVATNLGALHVRDLGAGPPTILWHSMFVDSHTWDLMLPHLPSGRRYLMVDGPGLGLSDPLLRETNIAEAAEAAVELLAALAITEPVDWVGNAFGGHVGFKLATQPGILRSLVAVSSPTEPIDAGLRRRIKLLRPLLRIIGATGPVRSALLEAMLTETSQADGRIRRIVVDGLERAGRASTVRAVGSFILNRDDVSDEVAEICVPSLFVASDDRGEWRPEDAAAAANRVLDARVVTVKGARTLIPLEKPAEMASLLEAFWAELDDLSEREGRR